MKQVILVNNHSFIDVITNSSSELFICDTKKNVEQVKDILQHFLDGYTKSDAFDNYNRGNRPFTMKEVFGEIGVIDESNIISVFNTFFDFRDIPWNFKEKLSVETYESFPEEKDFNDDSNRNEANEWAGKSKYDKLEEALNKWLGDNKEELLEQFKGYIFIYSESDNTIPYGLQQVIEEVFTADRAHLG